MRVLSRVGGVCWRVINNTCAASSQGPSQTSLRWFAENASEAVRQAIRGEAPAVAGVTIPGPSGARRAATTFFRVFLPVSGIGCLIYAFTHPDEEPLIPNKLPAHLQYLAAQQTENQEVITNWSGTHDARPKRYFQPETEADVEAFLRAAHQSQQQLRVVGSALSPNGLGLSGEGTLSMALMDKILNVDVEKKQVTVQAGCRVQQVADALKPYGLTLQNYASIREQQVGGFTQVGAHGTGAAIPPVDEQVVSMRLVTPALGPITLSAKDEPELFSLARVGLGALGVVTQLTLQCVPRHQLLEHTFTTTASEVKKNHSRWLRENQHLRYMWIPYTDTVVVVRSNPVSDAAAAVQGQAAAAAAAAQNEKQRLQPLRELYLSKVAGASASDAEHMSATMFRDALLAANPLNKDWVAAVNRAEAEYWRRSSGTRVGYSDEILGFDCGGQQWVLETAFLVAPSLSELPSRGSSRDMEYMETLLAEISRAKIPAPSPLEQRWTSGSSSALSPASGPPGSVHSWVGVIMYLPHEQEARDKVTAAFRQYSQMVQDKLMPRYNAVWHWAKLEPPVPGSPGAEAELGRIRKRLAARYPLKQFNQYRALLDPHNVLSNEWLERIIPRETA